MTDTTVKSQKQVASELRAAVRNHLENIVAGNDTQVSERHLDAAFDDLIALMYDKPDLGLENNVLVLTEQFKQLERLVNDPFRSITLNYNRKFEDRIKSINWALGQLDD